MKMFRSVKFWLLLGLLPVLAFFIIILLGEPIRGPKSSEYTSFFSDPSVIRQLSSSSNVRIYHLAGAKFTPEENKKKEAAPDFHGYRIISGPKPINNESSNDIADLLIDETYYGFNFLCRFDPRIGVEYIDETSGIDMLFCFKCGAMIVYKNNIPLIRGGVFIPSPRRLKNVFSDLLPEIEFEK